MTTFNDDEQIFGYCNEATAMPTGSSTIKESESAVLLEPTGRAEAKERCGLDLVIVLDFTDTMNKQGRSEILKKATGFVIQTLGPIHRVSIVSLSNVANRLCALRQINQESLEGILNLVNGITPGDGRANISDGLQMALQVLNGRKFMEGRSVGIILMLNSEQNKDGNIAAQVKVGSVPVYTFSFGTSGKKSLTIPHVLEAIANCFTGLLTLAVDGLERIISPETAIYNEDSRGDSVCITFGKFDDIETRQVVGDLILPPITSMVRAQVLKVAHIYSFYSNELRKTELESAKTALLFASIKRIRNVTEVEIVDPIHTDILKEATVGVVETSTLNHQSDPTVEMVTEEDWVSYQTKTKTQSHSTSVTVSSVETSTVPSSKLYYERQGFTTRDEIKK